MAGLRKAKQAETRRKLLEAARVCFRTLGYERATMRDIANRAKVTTGAIFANWPDKRSLYKEIQGHAPVSAELGAQLLAQMRRVVSGPSTDLTTAAALIAQADEA